MPPLSFPIAGCMRWGQWGARFSTDDYIQNIQQCIDHGITTFDHADIYGHYTTEAEFGAALKKESSLRSQIQIITKCGIQMVSPNRPNHHIKSYNTSTEYIIAAVEQSLANFGTDYIDVFLIHRPDPLLNPYEVAEAVCQLIQSGKIRSFGVSNFTPFQMEALRKCCNISFNQIEASITHLQPFTDGTLDYCLAHKIQPMAWSPLGGGNIANDAVLKHANLLAVQHQCTVEAILIAWLLKHPANILPVMGTTQLSRLLAVQHAKWVSLTREEWFALWTASTGVDVP